ncbi:hypothetical protein N9B73_05235 [Verrucomicrobiales bacterium]|nr:hypothetical protein [Verrucomicrobiales bacterium]
MNRLFTPLSIFWSMLRRATVLAPLFVVFQVLVAASWAARFFFPFFICLSGLSGDWIAFAAYFFAWLLSVALWRWNTFRNLLETPSSLL